MAPEDLAGALMAWPEYRNHHSFSAWCRGQRLSLTPDSLLLGACLSTGQPQLIRSLVRRI